MRPVLFSLVLMCTCSLSAFGASKCSDDALRIKPVLSAEASKGLQTKLDAAIVKYDKEATADNLIWFGRRTAYLGEYKRAIEIFDHGVYKHPKDARMFRHRGHRFISLRCFDDAIADFEKAAELIKGQPDEIEPDGIPNAKNTPTSTLQSNIWYHLGLAYYLKGDFENALRAYRECEKVSKNPDMLVATTNWLYVTLRRLDLHVEALLKLMSISKKTEVIENDGYLKLILLYKGLEKSEDIVDGSGDDLADATMLYGIGNWELINGRTASAKTYFERVVKSNQWSSFGYIAAEAELKRMGKD